MAPSFAARKHASQEFLRGNQETFPGSKSRRAFSRLLSLILAFQVLAFLQIVGMGSWQMRVIVFAGPFLLASAAAAGVREGDWRAALHVPAKAVFAQHHSAFGLCEKQAPARGRGAWSLFLGVSAALLGLLAAEYRKQHRRPRGEYFQQSRQ
jgi:hypothetical protein